MGINFDINAFFKDGNVFVKAVILVLSIITFFTPGAVALILGMKGHLLNLEIQKIIFFSAIISIPLYFLGVIIFLHPYKTLVELHGCEDTKIGVINIAVGSCLWGTFSGCGIYFIVNLFGDWLSKIVSKDISLHYIAVYSILFSLYGFHLMINVGRFRRNTGR